MAIRGCYLNLPACVASFVRASCSACAAKGTNPSGLCMHKHSLPVVGYWKELACFPVVLRSCVARICQSRFDAQHYTCCSVLWLLRFPPYGERHIHTEAAARGIDPSRIIFTDVAAKPVRLSWMTST